MAFRDMRVRVASCKRPNHAGCICEPTALLINALRNAWSTADLASVPSELAQGTTLPGRSMAGAGRLLQQIVNRQLDPSYRTSSNGWSAARWTNGHEDGDRVSIGCGNRRLGSRSQCSWRALRCVYSANWDPPDKAQVSDGELSASHAVINKSGS